MVNLARSALHDTPWIISGLRRLYPSGHRIRMRPTAPAIACAVDCDWGTRILTRRVCAL